MPASYALSAAIFSRKYAFLAFGKSVQSLQNISAIFLTISNIFRSASRISRIGKISVEISSLKSLKVIGKFSRSVVRFDILAITLALFSPAYEILVVVKIVLDSTI